MAEIFPLCDLCGTVPKQGLYDGIYFRRRFICSACEQQLVKVSPEEDDYVKFINGIKKLKLYP